VGLEQTTVESLCGRSISGLALVLTLMSHDHGCQLSFTTFFFDETDTLRRSCCCFDVQAGSVQPHSLASRLLLYLLYRSQWATRGKGKGLDTCYSATYTSQTRDQQRFTISEVTTDWHELLVPQRIMWPSIARANGQLDPQCS